MGECGQKEKIKEQLHNGAQELKLMQEWNGGKRKGTNLNVLLLDPL